MPYIDTKYFGKCETCRHHTSGGCNTYCDHGEEYSPNLFEIPTADVVEVKHGEWVKPQFVGRSGFRSVRDFICGICGKEYAVEQPCNLMNYCPYCGAKMEGAKK